jgi:hypothetical protein
MFPVVEGGVS